MNGFPPMNKGERRRSLPGYLVVVGFDGAV